MRSSLPFAALLGVALLLGCQDVGPVGPDGLEPQFSHRPGSCKGHHKDDPNCDGGGGGGGGQNFVFVDVIVTGGMNTDDPVKQQMELARKPGIVKIRANTEKVGTPFLNLEIAMGNTLAALTSGSDQQEQRISLNTNCEWSGRIEQTVDNTDWVIGMLPSILTDPTERRSVLVVIDEDAGVSENNTMGIWPVGTTGTWPGFRVKGSPRVTVEDGDIDTDEFQIKFSGGTVELTVAPPEDSRNVIHLSCIIFDDITFTVMPKTS